MKTNNTTANYIASKGVTKHMQPSLANLIWNDLRRDGWRAEGLTRVKVVDTTEHHFVFEKHGSKVKVSYRAMEVAS